MSMKIWDATSQSYIEVSDGQTVIPLTRAQYDALPVKDPHILYVITDDVQSSLIDDSQTSNAKTWSSNKITDYTTRLFNDPPRPNLISPGRVVTRWLGQAISGGGIANGADFLFENLPASTYTEAIPIFISSAYEGFGLQYFAFGGWDGNIRIARGLVDIVSGSSSHKPTSVTIQSFTGNAQSPTSATIRITCPHLTTPDGFSWTVWTPYPLKISYTVIST